MKLKIFSPFKIEEYTINWCEINTTSGNFTIKKNHAPAYFTLSKNKDFIFELDNKENKKIEINKLTFIHIKRDEIRLFL